jgi:chorismate-pyruvate lyase
MASSDPMDKKDDLQSRIRTAFPLAQPSTHAQEKKPPHYLPRSANAGGRRAEASEVPPAPSKLMQAMLTTDGSFTLLLEALAGEPVNVEILRQTVQAPNALQAVKLQTTVDMPVLDRTVLLKANSGRVLTYATSAIVLERLPQTMQAVLLEGVTPVGKLLRTARWPQFRELDGWQLHPVSGEAARHLAVDLAYVRAYTIFVHLAGVDKPQPIMHITEYFAEYLGQADFHAARDDRK